MSYLPNIRRNGSEESPEVADVNDDPLVIAIEFADVETLATAESTGK